MNTGWWKSFDAEFAAKEAGVKMILVHANNVFADVAADEQREKEIEIHEKCKKEFLENIALNFLACSNSVADFLFGPQIFRKKLRYSIMDWILIGTHTMKTGGIQFVIN